MSTISSTLKVYCFGAKTWGAVVLIHQGHKALAGMDNVQFFNLWLNVNFQEKTEFFLLLAANKLKPPS